MTASITSDARNLISLAERMGIPVDDAIRQVAQLITEVDRPPDAASGDDFAECVSH